MASTNRLKGQEVSIKWLIDGNVDEEVDTIKDCEVTIDKELLEEKYLGETAKQYDSVYSGVKCSGTMHVRRAKILRIIAKDVQKARKRAGGFTQVDITVSLAMPDGEIVTIIIESVEFGPWPISIGGSAEFVEVKWECSGSEFRLEPPG